MHLDPLMLHLVGAALLIVALGLALRRLGQPTILGYLAAGVILGPHGLAVFTDADGISRLGALGVLLLMFFVGMEVSPAKLAADWKVPVFGTLLQIAGSVGFVWLLGRWLGWPGARVVLLGFVISLSSTAVVIRLLQTWGELETLVGRSVLGVLLVQDLALIPMLLLVGFLSGTGAADPRELAVQGAAGLVLIGGLVWVVRHPRFSLPMAWLIGDDRELSVFVALLLAAGLAVVVGLLGLPTALGAFAAGVVVNAARETHWVHQALEPFRVVFVAAFFVSIGMLLDLRFMLENRLAILALFAGVMLTNALLNAAIFRFMRIGWRDAVYAGVLLCQVGEFSFVLVAAGHAAGWIAPYSYKATLCVIVLTLLASPVAVSATRRFLRASRTTRLP